MHKIMKFTIIQHSLYLSHCILAKSNCTYILKHLQSFIFIFHYYFTILFFSGTELSHCDRFPPPKQKFVLELQHQSPSQYLQIYIDVNLITIIANMHMQTERNTIESWHITKQTLSYQARHCKLCIYTVFILNNQSSLYSNPSAAFATCPTHT